MKMRDASGLVRESYRSFAQWMESTPAEVIARKREEPDLAFHRVGITFAVYGEDEGKERLIPFDIVPRIISAKEWKRVEDGLRQRVKALSEQFARQAIAPVEHYLDMLLNNLRSIGGRTYHGAHPGGLNSEHFPVNANEVESRRVVRFWNYGHTPGQMHVRREGRNPDYPLTLDLRRAPEAWMEGAVGQASVDMVATQAAQSQQ